MFKDLQQLEKNYLDTHRNPVNVFCHFIGIPMILISIGMLPFNLFLSLGLFAVGWLFQFIGHLFEGQKPNFFEDPRYLIVGPICFAKKIFGR